MQHKSESFNRENIFKKSYKLIENDGLVLDGHQAEPLPELVPDHDEVLQVLVLGVDQLVDRRLPLVLLAGALTKRKSSDCLLTLTSSDAYLGLHVSAAASRSKRFCRMNYLSWGFEPRLTEQH